MTQSDRAWVAMHACAVATLAADGLWKWPWLACTWLWVWMLYKADRIEGRP